MTLISNTHNLQASNVCSRVAVKSSSPEAGVVLEPRYMWDVICVSSEHAHQSHHESKKIAYGYGIPG